jgi:hypothetical protein
MFQHENIRGILETVPELANLQAQGVDVVNVLNYVVSTSVRKIIDTKYATKAKQATKILTMMGIPAHIETDDGMQVPLFKSKLAPIEGATPIEVVSSGGKVTLVTQKEKVPNLREQGKPKDVDGKKIIPATGASIANRPMAITAQARETMSLRDSVNVVNKGHNRENVPVWFSTTFDNISSDAGGAFYYRTAMNGDPVRKALAFNSTAAYLKTAAKNIANFSEVIPDIVEINKKSPYGTLLEEIQLTKKRYEGDDTVDDLAQQALDEKTRPKTKKFLEFLKNHPSDNVRKLFETGPESDETIFLSKKEFSNVMANYLASQDLSIESFRIAANNSQAASDETMLVISRQARLAFAG